MKKLALLLGGLLTVLAIFCAPQSSWAAPTWLSGEKLVADTPFTDDAYVVGESVTIDKEIRGDLLVVGGEVIINGPVTGDIWVVGGNLTLNGKVADDLRLFGGDVTVAGSVGDDLFGAGGAVTVADTAKIGGDVYMGVAEFTLYGAVNGDANLWTGRSRINGQIAGNANIRLSEGLSFGKEGRVAKKLTYWAPMEDTTLAQYAREVEFNKSVDTAAAKKGLAALFTVAGLSLILWKWLSVLLLGAVLIWMAPKYFPHLTDSANARAQGGRYIGAGLVLIILVPFLAFILGITFVGMPLSIVMMLAYVLMLILGSIVGAYAVGSYLRAHKHNNEWQQLGNLALGIVVLLFAWYIPVIGWLFQWGVIAYGVGSVWYDKVKMLAAYRKSA